MESSENPDEGSSMVPQPMMPVEEAGAPAAETTAPMPEAPRPEGRRTQLKALRERVDALSNDLASLTRAHKVNHKSLEADVERLRKDLGLHARSKDLMNRIERHDADSRKRLEKEVAGLRSEMAKMRKDMAKEAAKSRAKQEAAFSRVLAKVSPKAKKAGKGTKKKR